MSNGASERRISSTDSSAVLASGREVGQQLVAVRDYEVRAAELMPEDLISTLFGRYGDPDWQALTNNLDGLAQVRLRPRVMVDVRKRSLATTVLGQAIDLPVLVGPVGLQQRFNSAGEVATAQAAHAAGTIMALSTVGSYGIEELAATTNGPLWFQLYCFKDRGLTELLVRKAETAGYRAIILTVDNPGVLDREREQRFSFSFDGDQDPMQTLEPQRILRVLAGINRPNLPTPDTIRSSLEMQLDWGHIDWLRGITSLPIVVKGIQTAEDAVAAARAGVDGIVVSNHGGHALDVACATVETLPEVVEAVAGDPIEVYLDGGIRTGSDVLKCLALGARAVLVGRPFIWGLTVGGAAGVRDVLEIFRRQLDVAMAYCGDTDVTAIPRSRTRMGWATMD
jgi:4-hydroxymandelate oxidase